MTIKPMMLSLVLAATAIQVHAEDLNVPTTLVANPSLEGQYTATLSATHFLSGLFVDTFTFSPEINSGQAVVGLLNIGLTPESNIDFYLATLNDQPIEFPVNGPFEFNFSSQLPFTGPLTLTVFGQAGVGLPDNMAINANYSGNINVMQAVPEPSSPYLMLAGLMVLGFSARRKLAI